MSYARYPGIRVYSTFSDSIPDLYFDGIFYTHDSIGVGQAGLADFLSKNSLYSLDDLSEGRFWLLYRKNNTYKVCADDCGQEVIFYYHVDNIWAFSNSFLALVEHLTAHDVKLHLNPGSAASFFLPGGFGETLISHNSVVQQIKVLPRNAQLRIVDGVFSVESRYPSFDKKYRSNREMPNLNVLQRNIVKWQARLRGLADNHSYDFSVEISGGADSRLLLALLLSSGVDISGINFLSNPSLGNDYRIAGQLAKKYGFSLAPAMNRQANVERLSAFEQVELYLYGSLGAYHKTYFSRFRYRPKTFRLHGGGGGLLRDYYGGEFLPYIDKYNKFFRDQCLFSSIKDNYRSCLESAGYLSAGDHYLDFRCRFHVGRNWYKSNEACLITPLISSDLLREYAELSPVARSRRYLHLAYYMLLDPEILSVPFDEDWKSFPVEDVERMRSHISQWKPEWPENEEVKVFFGESPELVAYPWGGDEKGSVDELLHAELEYAKSSELVGDYFSSRSLGVLGRSSDWRKSGKRHRNLSHVVLLSKLEELGVEMAV
ncbi:hypothetical protein [Microbulbifer celer]|uniref:Asparagine synthetase domain-containing protein n=1 Tax=Microbulbifer celer TaxID=435905 RepID=A0ABW3U3N7_9GAMM|nr:hypothetical protein [Microbulbifer celer]UFN57873.1 hypothetical protein LPW13_02170 [Microbulbifer celer]